MTVQRSILRKRILLTGAAGGIGSAFFRSTADQYTFRLNHLLVCCIETPDLQFAVVHGISNNRFKCLDITSTRDLFGYRPEDDAFEIFQADLQVWLRG